MKSTSDLIAEVQKKVDQCLRELGFEPQSRASKHEALIHARSVIDGKCLRVVLHISDRDAKSAAAGGAGTELHKARLGRAVIRPTLAAQAAGRVADGDPNGKSPCD